MRNSRKMKTGKKIMRRLKKMLNGQGTGQKNKKKLQMTSCSRMTRYRVRAVKRMTSNRMMKVMRVLMKRTRLEKRVNRL
jgi:hypothetical protein